MEKLTLKQQRFADEYIISGNATQSAIKAGYSKKYAATNTDKLLKNTNIKNYIDERLKELEDKAIAKQEEVLQYLTSVMRGEHEEEVLYGIGEGVQSTRHVEVGAKDRIKAAELLGKRYGTWTDKVDANINLPTIISGSEKLED
ncbi:terminase small subunit [Parvimonas micra]|uniref:terminase small subunit n=1 Tax=Parvimonas micra TaxID=33033 RepID=UPI00241D9691|nr:terminase small subunit [Parvimonas micra]